MKNQDFIRALAKKTGKTQVETKELLNESIQTLRKYLDEDKELSIPGIGSFHTILIKPRDSYDSFKKQKIHLPMRKELRFAVSSTLKDLVKFKKTENEF